MGMTDNEIYNAKAILRDFRKTVHDLELLNEEFLATVNSDDNYVLCVNETAFGSNSYKSLNKIVEIFSRGASTELSNLFSKTETILDNELRNNRLERIRLLKEKQLEDSSEDS